MVLMNESEAMQTESLPHVLVYTTPTVSVANGTGAVLMRQFSEYPPDKLLNIYRLPFGQPAFQRHIWAATPLEITKDHIAYPAVIIKALLLGKQPPPPAIFQHLWRRLLHLCGLLGDKLVPPHRLRAAMEQIGFVPDVVFATCQNYYDYSVLYTLLRSYNFRLPVIQHFHDYDLYGKKRKTRRTLRVLNPHLTEVWALTNNAAQEAAAVLQRDVPTVSVLHCDLPAVYKREHRPVDAHFTAVIMGNIWLRDGLEELARAWEWVSTALRGLPPISWVCHPDAVSRKQIQDMGIPIEPGIHYAGYIETEIFFTKLCQADIAIIPYNNDDEPQSDYARFTLPSRITELASVGLPIFCVAGRQTEVAQFVQEHGIGVSAIPRNEAHFRATLLNFIQDREFRAACGARARALAEREFDITQYRKFFYNKLVEVARTTHQPETLVRKEQQPCMYW